MQFWISDQDRLAEILGPAEDCAALLSPRPRLKSPVVSLLTARTWSSRRNSRRSAGSHSRAESTTNQ